LLISVAVLPAGDGMCSVVVLSGEADLTGVELREALTAEVAKKPRLIAVDMSALTFIDSGALQMIRRGPPGDAWRRGDAGAGFPGRGCGSRPGADRGE
jgi:hypothetical protein